MAEKNISELFRLDNRTIVITGAAGLLGIKHAEAIAAYGGNPVLLDINNRVQELANNLKDEYKVDAIGLAVDITDESALSNACEEIFAQHGKIDGLVNNAANNPKMEDAKDVNFSRLENFPLDIWDKDISVGLTGAYLCSKYFGSKIAINPAGGSIVNIASDLGLIAPDQRLYRDESLAESMQAVKPVTYSVVKSGLIGLTRYLATYWPEKNVRCNALCPGGVENNQPDGFLKEVSYRIPMGRLAQPDEYQGTLVYVLSEASSYLNGAIIPIDGGRTVW